jgi:3-oxoacyl-(acyl-carrier-protein) synthase
MARQPVLISGMGTVSAAGGTVAQTLASLAAGERHAGRITVCDSPLAVPVFEVAGLATLPGERTLRLALQAVREALASASLEVFPESTRVGVCLGTTVASQLNDVGFYAELRTQGTAPLAAVDRYLRGNLAEAVAREIGAAGLRLTVTNACSSGTDAIGIGLAWLKAGLCDIVIAGGADELNRIPLCGFHSLGVTAPVLCSPFDRDRQGLNLGEGAGILVLETRASARRRGVAPGLAVCGFGSAADAHHLTAPRPDGSGLEAAIREALAEAGIEPAQIDFVNAHGTGTRDNDKVEGTTLARIFGDQVRFLSTKGYTGHTLGAAGGLEAAFSGLALREGWLPASAGFREPDPDIPVAPVVERTVVAGRFALSTSLAFGGSNAAVVIGIASPGEAGGGF